MAGGLFEIDKKVSIPGVVALKDSIEHVMISTPVAERLFGSSRNGKTAVRNDLVPRAVPNILLL